MTDNFEGLVLRSSLMPDGTLTLQAASETVPTPASDEIVIRVEAAPVNPADRLMMFPGLKPDALEAITVNGFPGVRGTLSPDAIKGMSARIGQALAVGNEGAGTVVAAGRDVQQYLGRVVALRDGMYAQYRLAKATECFLLPAGITAVEGAAASINPMTALGMVETMRREGHTALVHTAAASSLGQMLLRLCQQEGIELVNIVRRQAQVDILSGMGARHIIDSSRPDFELCLTQALAETGATLAFDAIGGGTMASTLLACMEQAQRRSLPFSRYGSPVHKQVYIYGVLDPSPRLLQGDYGAAWGVGGWLMTHFLTKAGAIVTHRLREKVAAELTTTFASTYAAHISLSEALDPVIITAYSSGSTGTKYLLEPHALR